MFIIVAMDSVIPVIKKCHNKINVIYVEKVFLIRSNYSIIEVKILYFC